MDLAEFDKLLADLHAQAHTPDKGILSAVYQQLRHISLRIHGV